MGLSYILPKIIVNPMKSSYNYKVIINSLVKNQESEVYEIKSLFSQLMTNVNGALNILCLKCASFVHGLLVIWKTLSFSGNSSCHDEIVESSSRIYFLLQNTNCRIQPIVYNSIATFIYWLITNQLQPKSKLPKLHLFFKKSLH